MFLSIRKLTYLLSSACIAKHGWDPSSKVPWAWKEKRTLLPTAIDVAADRS